MRGALAPGLLEGRNHRFLLSRMHLQGFAQGTALEAAENTVLLKGKALAVP
jgi:hypothetical protein